MLKRNGGMYVFKDPKEARRLLRFCEETLEAYSRVPFADRVGMNVLEPVQDLVYQAYGTHRYLATFGRGPNRLPTSPSAGVIRLVRLPRSTEGTAWYQYSGSFWSQISNIEWGWS